MEPKAKYGDAFGLPAPSCAALHTGYELVASALITGFNPWRQALDVVDAEL